MTETNEKRPDFSYLKQVATTETAEYEVFELEGITDGECPVLIVKCTADNPAYLEAIKGQRGEINREVQKRMRRNKRLRPGEISAELLSPIDRQVFPGNVIIGWRNVPDTDKQAVPWSVENCTAYLEALPGSIFEGLRIFCADPRNFRANVTDDDDTEDTAGNS